MGETPTRKMIGSRTFLFTILAVSCHGLPKITGEVVPEAQTMLLQHTAAFTEMSPTAFISAMASSGGSETDCRDFATKTTTDISTTVTSTQKMLDDVDTGSSCAAMGQDAVTTATAAVTAAKAELETAKTDKATKQSAKEAACSATFQVAALNLGSFKNNELKKDCLDISGMVGYTTADAACTTATTISTAADQAVVTATTKVTDAEASLATNVKEASKLKRACLCRVKKAQTAAWTAASTTIASHAADWKQAHEIVCALDKTTTCTVPACPAVTKPAVAVGVANAQCEPYIHQETGACGIAGNNFHERCHCGGNFNLAKTLAFCKEKCDSDAACVGYVKYGHNQCQYATTSTCPSDYNSACSKLNAGNVGEITPGAGATNPNFSGCYVKQ